MTKYGKETTNFKTTQTQIQLTGRNHTAAKGISVHYTRYKIRANDLEPQYQSGLPVSVLISVTYHDDKPVKVTDATKQIVLIKIPNNKDLHETYIKQELSMNATATFNVKTSAKDESGFILKVGYFVRIFCIANDMVCALANIRCVCVPMHFHRLNIWMRIVKLDICIQRIIWTRRTSKFGYSRKSWYFIQNSNAVD